MNRQEKKLQERLDKRKEKAAGLINQTKRLNKQRYEEPEEDVMLTAELTGSVRLIKVDLNVQSILKRWCVRRSLTNHTELLRATNKYLALLDI